MGPFQAFDSQKQFSAEDGEGEADAGQEQDEVNGGLCLVEEGQAKLLTADLAATEELFPFTGKTVLSRVLYNLRHAQHHFADLAMELTHRGLNPPASQ